MLYSTSRVGRVGLLLVLLTALLLTPARVRAQTPTWQTLLGLATSGSRITTDAIVLDAAGNQYIVGSFTGTLSLGAFTLTSVGQEDIYVAKYSLALGQVQWLQRAGGAGTDAATGVAVTPQGVYVTGYFNGPTSTFGSTTVTGAGTNAAFVAKLTDAGAATTFTWARGLAGAGTALALGVAVNGASVYVVGNFTGTIAYGSQTRASLGGVDGFLTRLTDAGTTASFDWLTNLGGRQNDSATGVAVQGSGVFVVGSFEDQAILGSMLVTSSGGADVYVTRLADTGSTLTYLWAQTAGSGLGDDFGTAVAVLGSGVFITGNFTNTALVGSLPLTSPGGPDGFVAKLTDVGTSASFSWARRLGGPGFDNATSVAVRNRAVYVGGLFSGTTTGLVTGNLTSAGQNDLFVVRLTDDGTVSTLNWAQRAGSPLADAAQAVAVGSGGTSTSRVYTAGTTGLPATFGALTLNPAGAITAGYVASFLDPIPTATTPATPALALTAYPNPAHTAITIPATTAATVLTLTDATGRLVRTGTGTTLSVLGLAPGLYGLRAATPGQSVRTARVVVE